jgi:thiamine-phosphate pyrophosphorylase
VKNEKNEAKKLKELRHKCKDLQDCFDEKLLLSARNSIDDPFSSGQIAAEGERKTCLDLLKANIKRSQEASRVIEEFAKLCENENACQTAKNIRFELYTSEKELL